MHTKNAQNTSSLGDVGLSPNSDFILLRLLGSFSVFEEGGILKFFFFFPLGRGLA